MAAVCPAEALDGLIRNPASLHEVMYAPLLVLACCRGVEAPTGAAGIGEHEDTTFAVLEILCLCGTLGRGSRLNDGFLRSVLPNPNHPPTAARDFCDVLCAEVV